MSLRNTIAKRCLSARIRVSTGAGARPYIPFNGLVPCNTPGLFPFQRLAINHTINPNLRHIHHSSLRFATPVSGIPEPSQLTGEKASRKLLVNQEIEALWSHPLHLFKEEKNYDMALALLRSRLKDPHAHLPSPVNGSIDELTVMGYYYLACVLHTVVRRDNLFGMPEDDELLHALRRAKEGLVRYNYDKGTQAIALEMLSFHIARRDERVDALQVHQQLVEVLRKLNEEDPMRMDPTIMDESGRKETPLDRLAAELQSLAAFHSQIYQYHKAVEIMEEACEVLEELEEQERTNPGMHAFALCTRAYFMGEAGINGSNVVAKEAASQLHEMIELIAENTECTFEDVLDDSDALAILWLTIPSILEKFLTDEDWREVYGDKTRREILTLAKERGIQMSKIPSNIRDSLPVDWDKALALCYYGPLVALSSKLDSAQEEVEMLEKALEVQLIQAPLKVPEFLRSPNRLPEDLSYSDFIKLFNWGDFTFCAGTQLIFFF